MRLPPDDESVRRLTHNRSYDGSIEAASSMECLKKLSRYVLMSESDTEEVNSWRLIRLIIGVFS